MLKLTPELTMLAWVATATVLMWVPYTLGRILTRGPANTLNNPTDAGYPPDPAWAERGRRAHANAVENLAVFAPLVILLGMMGFSTAATVLAARVYLGARLAHYVVYTLGIPVLRTLTFVTGVGATLVIAAAVLGGA